MPSKPRYFDYRLFAVMSMLTIFALVIIKIGMQNTLDARFYYSLSEAAKYFRSLSSHDWYRYMVTEIFDLGFIISYTSFFYLSLKRLVYKKPKIKYLALVPGFFDLIETVTILLVLFQKLDAKAVFWLAAATFLKWLSLCLVLLMNSLAIGFRLFRKKQFKTV